MKAFNFNLDVRTIIATMLESTKREVAKMLIYYTLLGLVNHSLIFLYSVSIDVYVAVDIGTNGNRK